MFEWLYHRMWCKAMLRQAKMQAGGTSSDRVGTLILTVMAKGKPRAQQFRFKVLDKAHTIVKEVSRRWLLAIRTKRYNIIEKEFEDVRRNA
jgi:hypothetical protein